MLALTRKKGESLVVNNNIEITVLETRLKSASQHRRMCRYTGKKYIYRFRKKMKLLLKPMG